MPKDKTEADLQKAAEEKAAQWYVFWIFVLLQVINFQKVSFYQREFEQKILHDSNAVYNNLSNILIKC